MPFELGELSAQPWTQALGWTFLHACWQGVVVVAGVALVQCFLDARQARARYATCAAGFAAMLLWAGLTLVRCWPDETVPATALPALPVALPAPNLLDRLVPWCALFWAAGSTLLHARLVADFRRVRSLTRRAIRPAPAPWLRRFARLAERVGTRAPVRLVESRQVLAPMVVGWLRPTVLVPSSLWTGLAPHQIEAILAHELAHVRRQDFLINIIQSLGEALLFFHPGAWWLSHRMRIEREHCCDDVAVALCGDPVSYARALQSLDELREARFRPALASNGGSLMSRIQRLVLPSRVRSRRGLGLSLIGLGLVGALSFGAARAGAFGNDDTPPAESLEKVDLVRVVAAVNPEQADLLAALRARGLDDSGLWMVVHHYVDSPEISVAIQRALDEVELQDSRRNQEHDRTKLRIANQRITEERIAWDERRARGRDLDRRQVDLARAEQQLADAMAQLEAARRAFDEMALRQDQRTRAHQELQQRQVEEWARARDDIRREQARSKDMLDSVNDREVELDLSQQRLRDLEAQAQDLRRVEDLRLREQREEQAQRRRVNAANRDAALAQQQAEEADRAATEAARAASRAIAEQQAEQYAEQRVEQQYAEQRAEQDATRQAERRRQVRRQQWGDTMANDLAREAEQRQRRTVELETELEHLRAVRADLQRRLDELKVEAEVNRVQQQVERDHLLQQELDLQLQRELKDREVLQERRILQDQQQKRQLELDRTRLDALRDRFEVEAEAKAEQEKSGGDRKRGELSKN